jgi:hypothetical protein
MTRGNHSARISQLLPLARECAEDLLQSASSLANQHPNLVRDLKRYAQLIAPPPDLVEWGIVWGVGIRIDTATSAAERRVADRLAPELEDHVLSALQSLRVIHAPLILATADGRDLQEQADRMALSKDEQRDIHLKATTLSANLHDEPDLIQAEAASVLNEAVEAIAAGPHSERGTVYGIATIKNLAIVMVAAAVAATSKLAIGSPLGDVAGLGIWEVMKKWPLFGQATENLGKDLQIILAEKGAQFQIAIELLAPFRTFIVANEASLRSIATSTTQLKWLNPYIDYVIRTN